MKETHFKPSPLGPIPHDWEIKPLKEILSLFGRIGFRGYNTTDIVSAGQGAITLSPSNMREGGMNYEKCTFLSWAKYEESPEIKIYNDDILMVKTGSSYGKIALVTKLPGSATINPQLVVMKQLKCSPKYLASHLSRQSFQSQIETIASGGAIPTMSQAKILELKVTLPEAAEQERIAKTLTDVDDLIATTEALLQKKRDIKQGAMQQLLTGKTRLPGFTEPWTIFSILSDSNVSARIGWQGLTVEEYQDFGDYFIIGGTDFDKGRINWKDAKFVSYDRFIQDKNIQIREGDVLITKDGTIGKVAFVDALPKAGTLNSGVFVVRSKTENLFQPFLALVFLSNIFSRFIGKISAGSTIKHLFQRDIVKFSFYAPNNIDEQKKIFEIISDMDSEIEALEGNLVKFKAIREAMMQQLLTGKIRLI